MNNNGEMLGRKVRARFDEVNKHNGELCNVALETFPPENLFNLFTKM